MSSVLTWIVRAGRDAVYIEAFRGENIVAIGWNEVGPVTTETSDEELDERFRKAYPGAKPNARRVYQSHVRRFVHELTKGDRVATYDPNARLYILGTIAGDVQWREGPLARVRQVRWTHQAARDTLSVDTRNGLGSIAALFRTSEETGRELWDRAVPLGAAVPLPPFVDSEDEAASPEEHTTETILREDVIERAKQFIEDRIAALDWKEIQELVAGILRAMSYVTQVSAEGADRGVDIFASPDGLGLQEPRIFVEVKHRSGAIGADDIRSFLGGRRPGDRCLYVSTGGFSKDARYEAERSNVPLTLIPLPKLRELLIQHYEQIDAVTRALIPLQPFYWPVE